MSQYAIRNAWRSGVGMQDCRHVLLRGLPLSVTGHDVRRLIQKADIKGVTDASLLYKDFRPTGKAVLTTSLPDYTPGVLSGASDIILPGAKIEAEAIYDIASLNIPENPADVGKEGAVDPSQLGTGPAARVPERKTVTITGIPGKRSFKDLDYLLEGFRLASDRKYAVSYIPKPPRKFTFFSKFAVYLESESEAQRLVRVAHLSHFKNNPEAPLLRARIIY
ncbi:hypothetical protein CVT26_012733 [Gymnopilus dilepis]|uniref:RRM domain-containing protein n=1 Tax=Gymnopilus dilepis TaxID=231916 RepID=A0A409WDS5_9AGAR|nr:hypothetical protein CVT26_012733 [Gymnopilus dilepis]